MEKSCEKYLVRFPYILAISASLETIFFHPSLVFASAKELGPIIAVGISVLVLAECWVLASTFCTVVVIDITTTVTWKNVMKVK